MCLLNCACDEVRAPSAITCENLTKLNPTTATTRIIDDKKYKESTRKCHLYIAHTHTFVYTTLYANIHQITLATIFILFNKQRHTIKLPNQWIYTIYRRWSPIYALVWRTYFIWFSCCPSCLWIFLFSRCHFVALRASFTLFLTIYLFCYSVLYMAAYTSIYVWIDFGYVVDRLVHIKYKPYFYPFSLLHRTING